MITRELVAGSPPLDQLTRTIFRPEAEALADKRGIDKVESRRVAGRPARSYSYVVRDTDPPPIRQRRVVTIVDGVLYTITFSAAKTSFRKQEHVFRAILASWRWS